MDHARGSMLRTLPNTDDVDQDVHAPRAALEIIQALDLGRQLDDSAELADAVYWLTLKGLDGMRAIDEGLTKAGDISQKCHPSHSPYRA